MLLIRNLWLAMKGILRSARLIINAELEPLNLSGAEGDMLFILLTGSDKLQQEQLAEQLDIGKAAVSRVIDSLESKGYVTRMRQEKDRRAYRVCLTAKALAVGENIKDIYDKLYLLASRGIADEEIKQVESLLSRVAENLQGWRENNT
ncbi:MAG: MarR family transcriptional regulator [Firmicutes bacterium]|nr:MarR family transcriptional regulator [Bacillota bacterium]